MNQPTQQKRPQIEYRYRPPQSYKVPKRTWLQRYPRLTVNILTGTCLLIFFSRPLYDCFIRDTSDLEVVDLRKRK